MSTTISIKSDYYKAKVTGTHELAPRVGHYVFQKSKTKTKSNGLEVAIMESLWKPLAEPSFLEGLTFEVAIRSFYSVTSQGPKHIASNDLINKMVVVKEVKITENIVSIIWDVLNENATTTKPKSLFAMAPMSYTDINKMNGKFGIDDNPDSNQAYDAPDDL